MEQAKILIVDDEPNIVEVIRLYLEHMGFQPILLYSGKDVLETVKREKPDLAVLDVMLPDVDGYELCRQIRELEPPLSALPLILLTAKGESIDKLRGFHMGADDYIVKPFDPNELIARIRAILRRAQTGAGKEEASTAGERKVLEYPELVVDLEQYKVLTNDKKAELTPKEIELLYFLAASPGRVYTREELLDKVWKFDFAGGTRTVDAHVKNIRKKLGSHEAWSIQTLWGIGYTFEVNLPC